MAYRLMQAGADCLLLEAGKDHGVNKTYPKNEMRANAQLMWGGGSDLTTDSRTVLLRGKVVGGGTIVNQCLLDRFDDVALDDWRNRTDMDWFKLDHFNTYYDRAEDIVHLHKYTRPEWNRNAELYASAFDQCGYEWAPLRRGESNCSELNDDGHGRKHDCMQCLGGCPRHSKQSSAVQSLARARELGLDMRTEFTVTGIVHGKHHVVVHGVQHGQTHTLYARRLIMAAGTLGTNQLLIKSGFKHKLPALGERFFCHPQFMSIGLMDEPVDAHKGAFQSLKSADPRFRPQGFKLENVFAGPIGVAMLKAGSGHAHQAFMQKYRNMACIEVCVRDEEPGTIRVSNSGRLVVDKPLKGADLVKAKAGNKVVHELLSAMGAKEIMQSKLQIALHMMGGCAIGEKASRSVVQPDFKVYGYDNIYITDGSIFPSAPGINPSLSIMAMSHMASDSILREVGHAPSEFEAKTNIKTKGQTRNITPVKSKKKTAQAVSEGAK